MTECQEIGIGVSKFVAEHPDGMIGSEADLRRRVRLSFNEANRLAGNVEQREAHALSAVAEKGGSKCSVAVHSGAHRGRTNAAGER